ncbi:phosphate ABC transporter permease PstA [Fannyhessea vaginae]|uniref:phosphate ABC transporter permease PstA n=1 Tax=Fannyhessea vaginae TaxID=82135 RepID=UPI003B20D7B7
MENNTIPAPGAAQVSNTMGASTNVCASTAMRAPRLPHEIAVATADCTVYTCVYISAALIVLLLVGIIGYVLAQGWPALNLEFFTCSTSLRKGTIGVAGNIINTLIIVVATLAIAIPIGVGGAIYLQEYATNKKLVRVIDFATDVLAGIPSIIFGLFGMLFFGQVLRLGYSLLCGALTLALMVLPLITRNTQEALTCVPQGYKLGAFGLGAGKWHTIRTILLPVAAPSIVTGVILALGRIVAESAALLFTAGSAKLLPQSIGGLFSKLFTSGGTLTVQLYLSATSQGDFTTAFGIACILLVFTLLINVATHALIARTSSRTLQTS